AAHVRVHLLALLAALQGAHRKPDLLLARVDVRDLGLDLVADLEVLARLVDPLVPDLRDVDEALDPVLDLAEDAEVRDARHRTLDARSDREALRKGLPRVGGELLDAEGDALVVDVDAEDDGLDLVALLVELGRVLDLLRPVEIGDVDEPVDPLLHPDED